MFDAIIIGGGPSGVAAAARIGQLGGRACLVEKEVLGGVCSNWGCIPTKAMIASARLMYESLGSERLGVKLSAKVDFNRVIMHRDFEITRSRTIMKQVLEQNNVTLIYGEGRIVDKNTVSVNGQEMRARNIILCTGSVASYPSFVKLNNKVLSSREMTQINEIPRRLVIMGGGVIGVEFATIFRYLGSDVTIVEMAGNLLSNEDPETGKALADEFEKAGIRLVLNSSVKEITDKSVVTDNKEIDYDYVLVATGRKPNLDEENLAGMSIKFDRKGITTNDRMQTSRSNIYAIGDNTGKSILAHVGIRQAVVAANNIMGVWDRMSYVVPRCVYSIPEVACVGKTEKEARNPRTATVYFSDNARASVEGTEEGFVKVILEGDYLAGMQSIGGNVTEIINEATMIIERKIKVRDATRMIHPHPTMSENLKYAMQKAIGELVEAP
jgi:dihydrolipoamide dehydrogenase